ncbi:MAG: hypothetical protein ACYCTV_01630 [Leptospirales bacterium]
MLIDQSGISRLIPHSGAMVLLDGVLDWDADHIRCIATSHHHVDNPLRDCGRLHCLCGIEYAAQAMAIHGSLVNLNGDGPPGRGYLASIRDLEYSTEWLDTAPAVLEIWAKCLLHDGSRSIYQFILSGLGTTLLSGRAAVVYIPAVKEK